MPSLNPPTPIIFADLCILTKHGVRKSRLYYEPESAVQDETDMMHICNAIFAHFVAPITNLLPDQHQFLKVEGRFFGAGNASFVGNSTTAAAEGELSTPATIIEDNLGSDSEDIMPDEAALIIQKKTGKRGRSKMGRLFIAGLSEAVNFAGEVSNALQGAAKNLATAVPETIEVEHDDYTGPINARHWDRKNNVMEPITKAYAVKTIGTRKDRRRPLTIERL